MKRDEARAALRERTDQPAAVAKALALNDASSGRRRGKMMLPAPQARALAGPRGREPAMRPRCEADIVRSAPDHLQAADGWAACAWRVSGACPARFPGAGRRPRRRRQRLLARPTRPCSRGDARALAVRACGSRSCPLMVQPSQAGRNMVAAVHWCACGRPTQQEKKKKRNARGRAGARGGAGGDCARRRGRGGRCRSGRRRRRRGHAPAARRLPDARAARARPLRSRRAAARLGSRSLRTSACTAV